MKNKKILIVCPYFYPEAGGLELYAYKIARHLSENNKVFVVCATKNKKIKKRIEKSGDLLVIRDYPTFFISNTPINFKLKKIIKNIIKEYKIDLIIAHTPVPFYADIAAKIAQKNKIPFILHYHVSSLYKKRLLLDTLAFFYEKIFEKKMFEISKKIISASYYPINKKLKRFNHKTVFMPPFIDIELFKPGCNPKKQILFVGQLDKSKKWKGVDNLLKAFRIFQKRNKEFRLLIIGSGNYLKHYKKTAERLELTKNTEFLGSLEQKKIVKYYQSSLFAVIPSVSNAEGTPTVLFEAMACGKPVIGGNVGGIPYIIKKEKCGIIVNAKNIKELAKKMEILTKQKIYNYFSKNCIKNINKYESEKKLKQIEKIYEKALT